MRDRELIPRISAVFWHHRRRYGARRIAVELASEAFGVTATLLNLGTQLKHLDSLHENATIEERLIAEQTKWTGLLQITRANQYDTGIGIATRRLSGVESALEILRAKSP